MVPILGEFGPKRLLGSLGFWIPKLPKVLELVLESCWNWEPSWREEARRRVSRGEEDWEVDEGPGLYLGRGGCRDTY